MNGRNYFHDAFIFDLRAGFITSIVALPLALAFAIASGVEPIMGLYTAIIAGILGSSFGGSRFSITGPTGAMTVIILSTVNKFGLPGLFMAGCIAGVLQIIMGLLGAGKVVKFIPLPVISGFTAGIGAIIFIGQIGNALGLKIPPTEFIGNTIIELYTQISSVNNHAVAIALGTLFLLWWLPSSLSKHQFLKYVPASLVPLIGSILLVILLQVNVPTVGSIPLGLPKVTLPSFSLFWDVFPAAFTIALLGSIEALLCAVVCDGMTDTKHDANKELRAQGYANIVMSFIGGIPVTAAIARSAVNIREGAKTQWAGVIHAIFLLLFMIALAPLVSIIPQAFLAGILMFVSLKMININEIKTIASISKHDAIVLAITMGFTILTDLVLAVEIGMVLAIFLLFVRFTQTTHISTMEEYDPTDGINSVIQSSSELKDRIAVYTLHGPFFFGAMNLFEQKIDEHMHNSRPIILIRMRFVPFIDSTGVARLRDFIHRRKKSGSIVLLSGVNKSVERELFNDVEFSVIMPKRLMFLHSTNAIEYAKKEILPSMHREMMVRKF